MLFSIRRKDSKKKKSHLQDRYIYFSTIVLLIITLMSISNFSIAIEPNINLTKIGEYKPYAGLYTRITVQGDQLYVGEYTLNTFRVLNISDPTNTHPIGSYNVHQVHFFDIQETLAYVPDVDYGFKILNISNPSDITIEGVYIATGKQYIEFIRVSGNYAYLSTNSSIEVVDISNSSNLIKVNSILNGFLGQDSFIEDTIAYFLVRNWTTGLSCLYSFDITDGANPVQLGMFEVGKTAIWMTADDNYVYLSAYTEGFMIVDFTNLTFPVEKSFVSLSEGNSVELEIRNNYLFVAAGSLGLRVYDISNKINPYQIGFYYDGIGSTFSLDIKDNLIFIADNADGIEILRLQVNSDTISGPIVSILILFSFLAIITINITILKRHSMSYSKK